MLAAINFDDYFLLQANEVDNEIPKRMLAAEAISLDLLVA
jgi:hypothetical protein